jgi:glutathione peroxidase
VYECEVTTIDGTALSLAEYRNQVLLIVNVASRCGYTPQYLGLEALHARYREQGFLVLGFPCDQFGHQEPGSEADIRQFCAEAYGVTFPMFSKIRVNGRDADPLFQFLKKAKKGWLGSEAIKWNFTKFLIDRRGNVIRRFAPADRPERLESAIVAALAS